MHAHTYAIRSYGVTNNDLAAEIGAVAAAMSTFPAPAVADAFGPVGARFAATLADTVAGLARALARVGEEVSAAGSASTATAQRYDDAEDRARARLGASAG
jgi:hypothetical protein